MCEDSDAFVMECSYPKALFSGHIGLDEIERYRSKLRTKKLILTHFGSQARAEAILKESEFDFEVADDGKAWVL